MRRLLYFHASWCGPCKFVDREFLSKVEAVHPDKIERINAENEAVRAEKHKVDKLPTTLILDDENEIFRRVGGFDTEEVIEILNDNG